MATLETIRDEITALDGDLFVFGPQKAVEHRCRTQQASGSSPDPGSDPRTGTAGAVDPGGASPGLSPHYISQIYHLIIEDSVLSQQAYIQEQLNAEQQEL